MTVYDRWHHAPEPGEQPCEHSRGRRKLYASADHGTGDRWQVRWREPGTGKQRKKNFALRDGDNRNIHADAFDKHIQGTIIARNYSDPKAGEITLQEYAETWRKGRTHGEGTAARVESHLRCHVYEAAPDTARTRKGGVSIGQHPMAVLSSRPSLSAAWIAAMPLAEGSRRKVVEVVSAVYRAAMEDGIIGRNPLDSSAVDRPGRGGSSAEPLAAADVDAIAAGLPERYRVLARLGAGTGMRQMEMSGLGADDITGGRRRRIRVVRQLLHTKQGLRFAPVKNRKPHDVPLAASLGELLDEHMRRYPPVLVTLPWHEPGSKLHGTPVPVRLVLTRPDATPLTRGSSDSAWRTAVTRWAAARTPGGRRRRVLAAGTGMHRLRHTYASMQLRKGVDVVRVAAWLGDSVDELVRTYAHMLPGDDGDAGREAVDAFFRPSAPDVPAAPQLTASLLAVPV
jgi:integrase